MNKIYMVALKLRTVTITKSKREHVNLTILLIAAIIITVLRDHCSLPMKRCSSSNSVAYIYTIAKEIAYFHRLCKTSSKAPYVRRV